MSAPTLQTYFFTSLQELMDRVPADRIETCMTELGMMLADTKSHVGPIKLTTPFSWHDGGDGLVRTLIFDGKNKRVVDIRRRSPAHPIQFYTPPPPGRLGRVRSWFKEVRMKWRGRSK